MSLNEFCQVETCSAELKERIDKFVTVNKKQSDLLNIDLLSSLFAEAVHILISTNSQSYSSHNWEKFISEIAFEKAHTESVAAEFINSMVEQGAVSFDLLTFVITKLDISTSEKNVSEIKKYLKTLRSDLVREEMKLADSKNNLNFINFANAIEFQMFNGEEYAELDAVTKIACIAGDFLEITKGSYSISDLLMIKTAMVNIGFSPKEKVKLSSLAERLCSDKTLENKIFGEAALDVLESPKEYAVLAYIDKRTALEGSDSYIVSTIENILSRNGIEARKDEIVKDIANKYMRNDLLLEIDEEIDAFDAIVTVLYEVNQYHENM